jgi:hypothetical protein
MGKKSKVQSIYRTSWSSIKTQCDPEALKRCNFSSGLGPALDKIDEQMNALYDLDPVPPKKVESLVKAVKDIQGKIVKYRDQVVKENAKHPELGPSWANLHEALYQVDKGIIEEAKQFSKQVKRLDGWKEKSEFQKRPVEGAQNTDVDHSDEVDTLLKKLAPHRDDIEKIFSVLCKKGIYGCFVYSPQLAQRLQGEALGIQQEVGVIANKLKLDPPDATNARKSLGQIAERVKAIDTLLGKDAGMLPAFLKKFIFDVLDSRIAKAESK